MVPHAREASRPFTAAINDYFPPAVFWACINCSYQHQWFLTQVSSPKIRWPTSVELSGQVTQSRFEMVCEIAFNIHVTFGMKYSSLVWYRQVSMFIWNIVCFAIPGHHKFVL